MSTFHLPDLGEGLQEAEIVAWHVAEGDHVVNDQPLVSVETEKAVVEIPSPRAGHIARLLARPGERVKVGAPLLIFEEGAHAEAGTVVGELGPPAPPSPPPPSPLPAPTAPAGPAPASTAPRAAPAVRARARELGVDLAALKGSGPDGAITLADVEAAAAAGFALRGARRTMAANMARAWREVAHATLHDWADIAAWSAPADVTVRLIRAIIAGCAAVPSLNASFDAATTSLRPNPRIDLGLAIDSPDGLFVPVLRDVGAGDAVRWRAQIDAAKAGVANRSLPPDALRGATFTLSNFGTIAGRHAALIIVPPQVAILGAGRIAERPVRNGGSLSWHPVLPLSLSFDHRAVTGGEAARFLHAVIGDLAKPA
jgi:2-oxoisovalerate dehydrogenase E2 component (dihydrolipoyl transacylase)